MSHVNNVGQHDCDTLPHPLSWNPCRLLFKVFLNLFGEGKVLAGSQLDFALDKPFHFTKYSICIGLFERTWEWCFNYDALDFMGMRSCNISCWSGRDTFGGIFLISMVWFQVASMKDRMKLLEPGWELDLVGDLAYSCNYGKWHFIPLN